MAKRTWTRTTWHPTPGTEITVTGHNFWRVGHTLMTVTGKVLGTGYSDEGSRVQGICTPAKVQLSSDEYVEAIARTQFGLVRPGETAVSVDGPTAPLPERKPGQRWWEALFAR